MIDKDTFFDGLSQDEGDYCETTIDDLSGEKWAKPLLRAIRDSGGVEQKNKGLLFELRFAKALHDQGIEPSYEVPGANGSTIDFEFSSKATTWFVELMRLEETVAVKAATNVQTDADGDEVVVRELSSSAADERQSEEGETLKAVQRICQKCEKDGQPYKFEKPSDAFNVLLVDFRTFLNGGDVADRIHIALGGDYLSNELFRRRFKGRLITGVFNDKTTLHGAAEARDRIHFVGFVREEKFGPEVFGDSIQFVANPHLFDTEKDVQTAIDDWPLQPTEVLNTTD